MIGLFILNSTCPECIIYHLFLILKGKIHLGGVNPVDVEDIAIGPSSDATRDFLYFGDVGNNKRNRKEIYIYKFLEPKINQIR